MKTFKRKVSCEDCYLSTYAPYGGCMCTTLGGKSLFECPGAITDEIVQKAHAAVLKARPAVGPEQLAKTKAELDQLLSEAKLLVLQLKSAKIVEEHKERIAQAIRACAAFGAPEQPLGTVAEPADPPPASEQPTKNGKAKIKVKIAMNIDLIAEYFYWKARLHEEEWYLDGEPTSLTKIRAERKVNELREKKSALEAKIMEKLMAK